MSITSWLPGAGAFSRAGIESVRARASSGVTPAQSSTSRDIQIGAPRSRASATASAGGDSRSTGPGSRSIVKCAEKTCSRETASIDARKSRLPALTVAARAPAAACPRGVAGAAARPRRTRIRARDSPAEGGTMPRRSPSFSRRMRASCPPVPWTTSCTRTSAGRRTAPSRRSNGLGPAARNRPATVPSPAAARSPATLLARSPIDRRYPHPLEGSSGRCRRHVGSRTEGASDLVGFLLLLGLVLLQLLALLLVEERDLVLRGRRLIVRRRELLAVDLQRGGELASQGSHGREDLLERREEVLHLFLKIG